VLSTCYELGGGLQTSKRTAVTRTVLIIGADLAMVFWVGRTLDEAGYDAYPARSVEAAQETLSEFHLSPDLVIVAGTLEGVAALVAGLRQANEGLRVLALDSGKGRHAEADGVHPSPNRGNEEARAELLQTVSAVFAGNAVSG
jgi:hypothetical protein